MIRGCGVEKPGRYWKISIDMLMDNLMVLELTKKTEKLIDRMTKQELKKLVKMFVMYYFPITDFKAFKDKLNKL